MSKGINKDKKGRLKIKRKPRVFTTEDVDCEATGTCDLTTQRKVNRLWNMDAKDVSFQELLGY